MENNPSNLSEALWRRKLAGAERERLRAAPDLELEARLTETLAHLANAGMPSNFTPRVLAAVELEEAMRARSTGWTLNWRQLWPRVAVAAAILICAGISLQRHETTARRVTLAQNLARVAAARPLPSADALENLDVIRRLSPPARADTDLLAALQ